jgi:molybdenum cofactor synthesis domain-containing protein
VNALRCGVLTVSDRAARGIYADESGPRLVRAVAARGWTVLETAVVPDEKVLIQVAFQRWCDGQNLDLVIATGGTGITPRDVTPEALLPLLEKELPGFGELMRAEGLKKTRKAALSRSFAGTRGKTLLIAVPGSPKGAEESFDAVADLIPAVSSLLKEGVCA